MAIGGKWILVSMMSCHFSRNVIVISYASVSLIDGHSEVICGRCAWPRFNQFFHGWLNSINLFTRPFQCIVGCSIVGGRAYISKIFHGSLVPHQLMKLILLALLGLWREGGSLVACSDCECKLDTVDLESSLLIPEGAQSDASSLLKERREGRKAHATGNQQSSPLSTESSLPNRVAHAERQTLLSCIKEPLVPRALLLLLVLASYGFDVADLYSLDPHQERLD